MSIKRNLFTSLFVCAVLFSAFCEDTVSISRIRIIIQEKEYVWNTDGVMEQISDESSYISPYTVASFSSLIPGKDYSLKKLEEEVMRTQMRLVQCGLFYSAVVQIIPPRKNPQERTIIITVTEGFLHRFSGGNAYAMYGREGLGGSRSGLYAYAGWNLLGLSYAHENLFHRGIILASSFTSLDLFPSMLPDDEYIHKMQAAMHAGKYITPDIGVTLFSRILFTPLMSSFNETFFSLGPVVRVHRNELTPFDFSWNMETSALWFMNQNSYKAQTSLAIRKDLAENFFAQKNRGQKLTAAVLLSGGFENNSAPESLAFNLYSTDNLSVRSGYTKDELLGISYMLFSSELRFNVIALKIPPAFSCIPQIFIFTDIAFIEQKNASGKYSFTDAFGGGLRFLLDNPIFAYFTFSYGINHKGNGRFVFFATGGY